MKKTNMKRCIKCRKCKKCDTNYSYKRVVEVLEKNTPDIKNITIWSCKVCEEDLKYVCMLCKKYHRRVYTLNMIVAIETAGDITTVNDIATICKTCMALVKCDECGKRYKNPSWPRNSHGSNEYRLTHPLYHLIHCNNNNIGAVCLNCYPNYVSELND